MKKNYKILIGILVFLLIVVLGALTLSSAQSVEASVFNKKIVDLNYNFDYAYIGLPDGSCVDGKVKNWKDWQDSDMIQVTMEDGTIYYTHSSNIVLITTAD